ncbi:DNA primase family protein [Oleidesulfovibrio alaskensis]|jgi:putative DNA primase/helicase|uniref:DNA primase family protein n=1 Tax=Oleidesulfovibrio alaskensis TaxID=58180 RepID=UPI001A3F8A80|nr:phage/plasmid primase, P4 family [Oleidesulfovibrio alaskensis]MBL3582605.1 DNA primase [Oleidesulfovibrio alaskensis]
MPKHSDSIADMQARVAARVEAEKETLPASKKQAPVLSDDFILKCLKANRIGDAMIFNALHREKFVYVKRWGRFLRWAGHHWQEDIMETALAAVEDVCSAYLRVAASLGKEAEGLAGDEKRMVESKREKLFQRVHLLRAPNGRDQVLRCTHTIDDPLAITGDELDQKPMLLACRNGVLDLRSGDFRAGRPDDYILNASPIEWKGIDEPCPTFEKFIYSCHENEAIVSFLQRALGYGIMGERDDHYWFVFYGARGRNGKDTLLKILTSILGDDLASTIETALLLDTKLPRNSGGPSPDILALRGKRMAFATEAEDGQRFAMSKIKWLTGGSKLSARGLQDKLYTTWKQTHLLFLLTNEIPRAKADDDAFWTRIMAVPWKLRFVDNPVTPDERPRDPKMEHKLMQELPGILAWLVRGCLEYQRQGLNPPEEVLACTKERRNAFDDVGRFLAECCAVEHVVEGTESNTRISATALLNAFNWWLHKNVDSSYSYSARRLGDILGKKGIPKKKSGGMVYLGVSMLPEVQDEMDADQLEASGKDAKDSKRRNLFE